MVLQLSRSTILRGALAASLSRTTVAAQRLQQAQRGALEPITVTAARDDARQIFGNFNDEFDREPRAWAQTPARAGVNQLNQAANFYDLLGRSMVSAARLAF